MRRATPIRPRRAEKIALWRTSWVFPIGLLAYWPIGLYGLSARHFLPLLFVLIHVLFRDHINARINNRRRRLVAILDIAQHLHRLAAPAEILLAEQHLHLVRAQQIESRADRVERNHFRLFWIHCIERV